MTTAIHFITGKGGTGKSLIAAGIALREARTGRSTLLIELGERSFYKDLFDLPRVSYAPTNLAPNLDVALWTGPDCLREYAGSLVKVESLTRLLFENSVSRSLINIAPGLPELAILGKATSGPRNYGPSDKHDVLVIDAYATGHFLSLLKAPKGLAEAIRLGPMGEQSRSIDLTLRDKSLCHYHVVSLPEEMPASETEELVVALRAEMNIEPHIVLNKFVQVPEIPGTSKHPFAEFLQTTKERQNSVRLRLQAIDPHMKLVPWVLHDDAREVQSAIAEALR